MIHEQTRSRHRSQVTQKEAVITWEIWALVLIAIAVTNARLDPSQLYHVSGHGLSAGLSRVIVVMNFPLAIVAVPLALIALDVLAKRWWWLGGPAIAMCLVTAWPGVVDNADLDARPINAVPAIGVVLAFTLALAASKSLPTGAPGRLPLDTTRFVLGGAVLLLSLPWLAAEVGLYLPDNIFITERPITGSDGLVHPAVHLGHHHGFDGALLIISAALLSRIRLRSRRLAPTVTAYLSLMFAYGAVNFAQDLWHEQVQKRDWVDWLIPKALEPASTPIWLVILAITAATILLLRHESRTAQDWVEREGSSSPDRDGGLSRCVDTTTTRTLGSWPRTT